MREIKGKVKIECESAKSTYCAKSTVTKANTRADAGICSNTKANMGICTNSNASTISSTSTNECKNPIIFHVYGRGFNRKSVLKNNCDKRRLLYYIQKLSVKQNVIIYAFTIMDNHFHLLVSGRKTDVEIFIKLLRNGYSGYYCAKYKIKGKVFECPFSASAKYSLNYVIDSLLYIINNPPDAGMCKSAGDYKWSSYMYYTKKVPSLRILISVDTSLVSRNFRNLDELKNALYVKLASMRTLKKFKY